jgi:hypothetical protein
VLLLGDRSTSDWLRRRNAWEEGDVALVLKNVQETEGGLGHRGAEFEAFGFAIDRALKAGRNFSADELVTMIGRPDVIIKTKSNWIHAYRYTRYGVNNNVVVFNFGLNGLVAYVSFSDEVSLRALSVPSTQPSG